MTIKLWIYTAQMKRMLYHLYPNAKQISAEVYEIFDNDFSGTQEYVGDMCGRTFSVVNA